MDNAFSNYGTFIIAGTDISFSSMKSLKFYNIQAPFSNFAAVNLTGTSFKNANLSGSTFTNGSCDGGGGSVIEDCDPLLTLTDVDFSGSNLTGVEFSGSIEYGDDKDIFSEACYTQKGIEYTFLQLDCRNTEKPLLTGVSLLVTGKPRIPSEFKPIKECIKNKFQPSPRKDKYFMPAYDKKTAKFLSNILEYAKGEKNLTAKKISVDQKTYCNKGACRCPEL